MLTGRGCHRAFQEDEIAVYLDLGAGYQGVGVIKQSPSWTLQTRVLYGLYSALVNFTYDCKWPREQMGDTPSRPGGNTRLVPKCIAVTRQGDTGEIGLPRKGRQLN